MSMFVTIGVLAIITLTVGFLLLRHLYRSLVEAKKSGDGLRVFLTLVFAIVLLYFFGYYLIEECKNQSPYHECSL